MTVQVVRTSGPIRVVRTTRGVRVTHAERTRVVRTGQGPQGKDGLGGEDPGDLTIILQLAAL